MREIETGDCFIGAVAQRPFESTSDSGSVQNAFCTLQPLAFEDGTRTDEQQFPNCGLVWWMLAANDHRFAKPGRLVSCIVEPAAEYRRSEPDKHLWQAKRGSVKPCTNEMFEILDVPSSGVVSRPNDLVSVVSCTVDHPPCANVLVRWHDHLYGPLRAAPGDRNDAGQFVVTFETLPSGPQVSRIAAGELDRIQEVPRRIFEVEIALDASMRNRSAQVAVCRYELIPAPAYREITRRAERVRIESDSAVLRRMAKDVLGWNRAERSRLYQLLHKFEGELTHQHEYTDVESVTNVLRRTRDLLEDNGELAAGIADALIESGVVEKALEDGISRRYQEYIESRTAKTAADIEERLESKRKQLDALVKAHDELDAEIESESRTKRATLERECEEQRAQHDETLAKERAALDDEKKNLDRQRQVVERRLAAVTNRFVEARDDVIKDLLTLVPLLNRVGFPTERGEGAVVTEASASSPVGRQDFKLRSYVSTPMAAQDVTETAFFERFAQHVQDSGYVYRRTDLVAFHVSVKVSDLTVLGGVSGTGKSSLPRLYAQALTGDADVWDDRYRMVGVNPSWLDVGDLLGRVNVLDARFLPSDSGLYDLLIHAHEEYRRHTRNSGLYIVCLDEMNLAQVEHYFSPFLQVLEAPPDQRRLRCFAPESVSTDSDFAKWAILDLPPSLRFVGTVNFDETTRPLSLRVLDRVNLITLHPGPLSDLDASVHQPATVPVSGPAVTHGQFESWRRPGQAGPVAEVLDALRDPLARLGCPLSPRRYRALCEFLASARELVAPEEALDMQITQRLLPQIRGLFRRGAQDALGDLRSLLDKYGNRYGGALRALDELSQAEELWPAEYPE